MKEITALLANNSGLQYDDDRLFTTDSIGDPTFIMESGANELIEDYYGRNRHTSGYLYILIELQGDYQEAFRNIEY